MNTAFKLYGKQPSTELAKEALITQSKYNLTDAQMVGLLHIHDFFQRITAFDVHISRLRIAPHKETQKDMLPQKTRDFFFEFSKCSELSQYFCSISSHKYFQRFADKILTSIKSTREYVADGLIQVIPEKHINVTAVEYKAGS